MKKLVTICSMVGLLFASAPALANPTMIGGPDLGNSWLITASAPGPYDLWAIRISPVSLGIDTFEVGSPALQTATAGWSTVMDTPSLVSIAGPSGSINLDVYFTADTPPALLEIDHALFNGSTKVIETHWVLVNGSLQSWSYSTSWNPTRADVDGTVAPVPVPGAFLLGGIGVSLVGWMKRRRSL